MFSKLLLLFVDSNISTLGAFEGDGKRPTIPGKNMPAGIDNLTVFHIRSAASVIVDPLQRGHVARGVTGHGIEFAIKLQRVRKIGS